jgi:glycosyltransferase involved in cell wall biosynthesis
MKRAQPVYDVCVLTTIHPPYEPRIWARCAQAYCAAGLKVCLVSTWPKPAQVPEGLSWVALRRRRSRLSKPLNSALFFAAALRTRSKVLHFHDLDFLPFAALLALLKPWRVIYDRHEDYGKDVRHNKEWLPRALRGILAGLTIVVEKACVQVIRNVIVTVPAWERQFPGRRLAVTTIHNYSAWEAQRGLSHERGIVYSGSMSPGYGVHELVGIARALKTAGCDLPIHVSLKNASGAVQRWLSEVKGEGLPFMIWPRVPAPRIGELLSRGCIGLSFMPPSPEKLSSISAKLFEYMAFGLPVVGEGYGYTAWYIREAGCGLLADPQEPSTYARAVMRLLHDPALLERCRENGFAAIERRFNWSVEEKRLLAFYRVVRLGTATTAGGWGSA